MSRKRFEFSGGVWRQSRKPRYRLGTKLLFLAAVSAVVWSFTRSQPSNTPITIVAAQRKDIGLLVKSVGSVQPAQSVVVHPQVSGVISEILFTEGQNVKKGDILARIDSTLYSAQLSQAIANKEQDEAQLQANKTQLRRLGKATNPQVQLLTNTIRQFEAAIKSDIAAIEQAQALMNYTAITAPIDGRAGIKRIDAGNMIQANDKEGIVEITQMDSLSVIFTVPEQNLSSVSASLAQGLPLHVTARDNQTGDKLEEGMVELADNQISPHNGTLRMKARFANTSRKLWPGAMIQVQLSLGTISGATVVPFAALMKRGGEHFVYKVDTNKKSVSVQPVRLVITQGEEAAIEGLNPGDQLAVQTSSKLAQREPEGLSQLVPAR